ncbi:hypothetical protein BO221_31670 [Archangium sp. Cb G35]|nr:hypothetical protein BO221_31670 [Archangium sp. Cb G35]
MNTVTRDAQQSIGKSLSRYELHHDEKHGFVVVISSVDDLHEVRVMFTDEFTLAVYAFLLRGAPKSLHYLPIKHLDGG